MLRLKITLFLVMAINVLSFAQKAKEDSLIAKIKKTTDLKQKLNYYAELGWMYRAANPLKADSLEQESIDFAEETGNPLIAELAWIYKAGRLLDNSPSKKEVSEIKSLVEIHLKKSKELNLKEIQSYWNLMLASCAAIEVKKDDIIKYANAALVLAEETQVDSIMISAYQKLATAYAYKDDKISQFRQLNFAVRIAERSSSIDTKINAYDKMISFYWGIKKYGKAKDYAFKVKELAEKSKDINKKMSSYYTLGNLYADDKQYSLARKYLNKILTAADSMKSDIFKGYALLGIGTVLSKEKKYREHYNFFTKQHPELLQLLMNYGNESGYYSAMASSALSAGMLFEAHENLKKLEADSNHRLNDFDRINLFDMFSKYYAIKKDYPEAINYAEKSFAIADGLKDVAKTMSTTRTLDTLYLKVKNYSKAYQNRVIYQKMKDSLDVLKEGQELMGIEIETENKREIIVKEQEEETVRSRNNLQYLGITVGIATLFVLLIMLGVFDVSENTIKALGFFAFIFLFEFIIFLADVQIHHLTHGEPIKIMGIKIILVAALVPFHHWLEHKVIHYLLSKDMIQRKNVFLDKWLKKKGNKTRTIEF